MMNFIDQHLQEVKEISETIDREVVHKFVQELESLRNSGGRLFILGVGGSAGNAAHAVNDFRKLAGIEAYAPTDNVSEITARTNDEGWETIFDSYLQTSKLRKEDCILILSVGGGDIEKKVSINLCRGIDYARKIGARVLALVGKSGGYAHQYGDLCLVIPEVNRSHITPHSEAFQVVLWHLFVSHPKLKVNETKW